MIPHTLACLLTLPLLAHAARPKNAILLSEVQSLTLRGNGAMTSHRRVPALPQLKCISRKEICDLYDIDVMRCTNQGSSYGDEDIQWSCKATLPEELKLGSTDVICEGYSSPDDPYVLKGSCGVEYRLALTSKGQHRYPDLANGGGWFNDGKGGTDWGAWVFTIIFVAILVWIIYSACFAAQDRNTRPTRRRPGFGGGGGGWNPGWGPDNDPPPPYPGTKPSDQQQGWQPGFWSGLAGGAAAGYFAGNRGQRHDSDYGSIGRGNNRWGAGSSGGRSSSNSSGGSARHESTGFGSTSRR
ncbi:Fc.00g111390.m01.CDS01 [Cosmosporella sp. VM-42]